MLRPLLLLGLVAATACFEEPGSIPSTPVDETSTGTPDESDSTTSADDPGSSSDAADSSTSFATGSSTAYGSSSSGEGCERDCIPDRECWLTHADDVVRLVEIDSDGGLELLDELGVASHASGFDAPFDQSIVHCGGRVFVATNGSDEISTLALSGDGLVVSGSTPSVDVLELACDEDRALLFALRLVDNGYAVDVRAASDAPDVIGSAEFTDPAITDFRTVRLALDRGAGQAWVAHVEFSPTTRPVVLAVGTYDEGGIEFGAPEPLPVVNGDISRLHMQPDQGRLLGLGTLVGGNTALFTVPVGDDGTPGPVTFAADPPWSERRNLWPVRLGGEPGLALGGTQGVVLATFGDDGLPQTPDAPVASSLSNTIARPAFGGRMLAVAAPDGLATFDLMSPDLAELDADDVAVGTVLHGAAVVACP